MVGFVSEPEIRSSAATVLSVARHFAELRSRTELMLSTVQASERGFFTPTEDDGVRQVLVSYWTARSALFELMYTLRDAEYVEPDLHLAAIIVSYAAALILVDAARFLRECFHHRPVVRAKLNEPEPAFGLPAGIYDQVQQSLTSPYHIWHLYHAGRVVEERHADALQLRDRFPQLAAIDDLIERLQDRLKVSTRDYAVARIRANARAVRTVITSRLLVRAMYGLQKFVSQMISGHFIRPGHVPQLPVEVAHELRQQLRPGDVLITRKEYAITNYFLPGFWPHAALYMGTAEELTGLGLQTQSDFGRRWSGILACDANVPGRVLEALKDGVHTRSVQCPLGSDAVAVLRPVLSGSEIASALQRAIVHDGKPYDFDFDFTRSDRMVCTEVVYRTFDGIGGIQFQLTRRAGRLTLSAEDLLNQAVRRDGFHIHAVFCPGHSGSLEYSGKAEDIIRRTAKQQA
ncbi:MAG: hypothetical protein KDA96_15560 [Planctomycetaceae bacterium]|nr:hypothetical protein [Planctomycetaceae bacterium]